MKKTKVIYKIILLVMIIIVHSFYECNIVEARVDTIDVQGGGSSNTEGTTSSGGGGGSVGLPSLDGYGPNLSSGRGKTIISSILGALTVVGTIMVIIAIAIIGFNTILGSASEKAEYNQKLVGVIIAAIILTCGSIIARVLISVAEKF